MQGSSLSLFQWNKQELTQQLSELGIAKVHANHLFRRLYREGEAARNAESKLPKTIKATFGSRALDFKPPRLLAQQVSKYDGSVKFLLDVTPPDSIGGAASGLAAAQAIEAVLIPEKGRLTLCVSSQVGCRQACRFCHTGRMGLIRQLTAQEIVAQVLVADRWVAAHPEWQAAHSDRFAEVQGLAQSEAERRDAPPSLGQLKRKRPECFVDNVVFMGMGEPLDNADAVVQAIRILTDADGLGMAQKRISVSTSGHLTGMRTLIAALPQARIAVSLHAPTDSLRSKIMPINKRWPLADLLAEIKSLNSRQKHAVFIQYTLMGGLNDSPEQATQLAELLAPLRVKVNLIPFNDFAGTAFRAPTPQAVEAFRDVLHHNGLRVMVRYSKGQDIDAACGQLVHSTSSSS